MAGRSCTRTSHRSTRTEPIRSGGSQRLAAILLVLELTGASAIKCYYAARGISTTAVAGLRVPANAIASGSIDIDTDVRVHTKTSLSVRRRFASPACIAGVRVSHPNFRARWGLTKLWQQRINSRCSSSFSLERAWGKRSSSEVGRALPDGQIQPLDERCIQCRRVVRVFEHFLESPRGTYQRSSFDLHDTIIPARLEDLRTERGRPENAADSVTLFS